MRPEPGTAREHIVGEGAREDLVHHGRQGGVYHSIFDRRAGDHSRLGVTDIDEIKSTGLPTAAKKLSVNRADYLILPEQEPGNVRASTLAAHSAFERVL